MHPFFTMSAHKTCLVACTDGALFGKNGRARQNDLHDKERGPETQALFFVALWRNLVLSNAGMPHTKPTNDSMSLSAGQTTDHQQHERQQKAMETVWRCAVTPQRNPTEKKKRAKSQTRDRAIVPERHLVEKKERMTVPKKRRSAAEKKERTRIYNAQYRERNKDWLSKYKSETAKARYRANVDGMRDKAHARNKAQKTTPAYRFNQCSVGARRRSLVFNITREQFDSFFYADACFYCGVARSDSVLLGIDRYDNTIGYEAENCRPCCGKCNYIKSNIEVSAFLDKCRDVRSVATAGPPALSPEQVELLPRTAKETNRKTILRGYKRGAIRRGLEYQLADDDFMRLLDAPCHYCWTAKGGVDRMDNNIGYLPSNSVPCCGVCNHMKHTYSVEEFVQQCVRVANIHR
ncbi:hypothetical protein pclt_cds_1019 [Pandoravirus celtis]|uniref:Uncharacterized protein n=1 Tax=Pandoravirus celtis TaxID=2568002 RepID=A0A4D6EIL1_9VIRU|nr:hypothetical protein pclt_cds_1019 [Pandoravirus celtis]